MDAKIWCRRRRPGLGIPMLSAATKSSQNLIASAVKKDSSVDHPKRLPTGQRAHRAGPRVSPTNFLQIVRRFEQVPSQFVHLTLLACAALFQYLMVGRSHAQPTIRRFAWKSSMTHSVGSCPHTKIQGSKLCTPANSIFAAIAALNNQTCH